MENIPRENVLTDANDMKIGLEIFKNPLKNLGLEVTMKLLTVRGKCDVAL